MLTGNVYVLLALFIKEKIMALSKTVTTPQGFEAVNAYHRVESVSLQSKTELVFLVSSYKDADQSLGFASKRIVCPYDLSAGNVFEQAYLFLKGTEEFSGSVDC
jgi:hypothetical protein